jgi:FtsP/CotA-like multicopper oxidase with cupredoxin domain
LTLIEADGTLLAPTQVSGVVVAVAQRYSVLLHANQTSVQNGTFWMRATLQTDMFLYQLQGQNVDIRGVIRYGLPPFKSQYEAWTTNMSALGTQTARNRESLAILPQLILDQAYLV